MPSLLSLQLLAHMLTFASCSSAAATGGAMITSKPHIVTLLADDMGWFDSQVHNPDSFMTPNLGSLARSGIRLLRHYTYKLCSPTRRSILSGRFPAHISGGQAPTCSNYLPLQFTLLPAKLKQANYETHMVGKGHLGYMTTVRRLGQPAPQSAH